MVVCFLCQFVVSSGADIRHKKDLGLGSWGLDSEFDCVYSGIGISKCLKFLGDLKFL